MSAEERRQCIDLIHEAVNSGARKEKAAEILEVSIRTVERWEKQPEDGRKGPSKKPFSALTDEERGKVLEVSNSQEFRDLSPWQIVPKLADRGEYIASESTFYRVLKAADLLSHRTKSQPPKHKRPEELTASGPNQVWSWDITFLKAEIKGKYYYLYLPMDIFSRMIVHWEVYEMESAENASRMIAKAYEKQGVKPGQVILHSDNGSPMKGATMLATLQRLGIAPSFSRPKVSDDNPFSESLFKTVKHFPSFPEHGFASIEKARKWVEEFVSWYNNDHLHSGINWVTPASRHHGQDQEVLDKRHKVYQAAKAKNPSRWSGDSRDWSRPNVVELNPGRRSKKANKFSFCKTAL